MCCIVSYGRHGRQQGEARGHLPPGILKNDVICCRPTKWGPLKSTKQGLKSMKKVFKSRSIQKHEQHIVKVCRCVTGRFMFTSLGICPPTAFIKAPSLSVYYFALHLQNSTIDRHPPFFFDTLAKICCFDITSMACPYSKMHLYFCLCKR